MHSKTVYRYLFLAAVLAAVSYLGVERAMLSKIRGDIEASLGNDYAIIALHMEGEDFEHPSLWRMLRQALIYEPTYLLADVEVVKTYKLYNLNANKLENLFHKLFASAKLDIEMKDRFGKPYKPREWFLVPLPAIQEAVERLKDGSLSNYVFDPQQAKLIK